MRFLVSAATLLAAALAAISAPAAAAPDFHAWLAAAIDRDMVYPAGLHRRDVSGIATVRFSVSGGGRPTDVAIVESSGHVVLDRAALRTIASLDLPASAPRGPHLAVLQYGTAAGEAELSAHSARLQAATGRARLALRDMAGQRALHAPSGGGAASASTLD